MGVVLGRRLVQRLCWTTEHAFSICVQSLRLVERVSSSEASMP